MLALTRRVQERIMIDGDALSDKPIEITILAINKSKVVIGIEAPKEIKVHRKEIYHKMQQEKLRGDGKGSADEISLGLAKQSTHRE